MVSIAYPTCYMSHSTTIYISLIATTGIHIISYTPLYPDCVDDDDNYQKSEYTHLPGLDQPLVLTITSTNFH